MKKNKEQRWIYWKDTERLCPVCGVGYIEKPKHDDEKTMKKICAIVLDESGYSIRQISKLLGYKSPRSVWLLLNEKA